MDLIVHNKLDIGIKSLNRDLIMFIDTTLGQKDTLQSHQFFIHCSYMIENIGRLFLLIYSQLAFIKEF